MQRRPSKAFDASTRMPLPSEVHYVVEELRDTVLSRPSRYVELSVRSNFSFLRGGSHPEDLVRKAKMLGYDAMALTDLDGIYGMARAWQEAKRVGLRLIIGAELTVEDGSPVALYVENHAGYSNLCRILTESHARHKKGEAGIPLDRICAHAEGLWSVLLPSEPRNLDERGVPVPLQYLGEEKLMTAFDTRFSVGVFLDKAGRDRERLARAEDAARRVGAPLVALGRVLYVERKEKELLDVLTCIREGMTLESAGRRLHPNAEQFLRGEFEMVKGFGHHPEWVARTRWIADACTFSLSELKYQFPVRSSLGHPEETPDAQLRRLTYEGAAARYDGAVPPKVSAQIEKELSLIAQLAVAPYFLSVYEIVQMARRRDILCQGRGSAANSAVCFALGVTAVDPARSNLLFERFLSAERHEPPDIDVDFEHERREEVIQEIYETYGRERAAMVSEVICYRGKSSLREVGKVLGFSFEQLDRLTSLVSFWDGVASISPHRLREFGFDPLDGLLQKALSLARRLQGFPRHLSIHVGGFVLSAAPLVEVTPIEPATMPGRTVVPWDKDDMDALGFFKVDVLGLGMLTAIRKCLDLVRDMQSPGDTTSAIDRLAKIPKEDPAVYDALCRADTVGVFQIESRAQMAMLPRLRPRRFYDLVVEVAIVRPGPIQGGMVHPYLRRRNGEEPIDAPHPLLEPILTRTLGVPLFQEQVMQIAIVGAGYTGGEADQLRRDMAAWRKNGNLARHRERLRRGFLERGISEAFAERLYTQIQGFGEYGFPESHAASFALLVYASSWLKLYFPAAFAAALINSQPMGFYSPSTLLEDAKRHGVEVRPIDVSASQWDLTLETSVAHAPGTGPGTGPATGDRAGETRAIRLGFRLIKGLGEDAAKRIIASRARLAALSTTWRHLAELAHDAGLDRRELACLAEAGALAPVTGENNRRRDVWRALAPKAEGLFAGMSLDAGEAKLTPPTREAQLCLDYARTGVSQDHPLQLLRARLPRQVLSANDLRAVKKGRRVQTAGMVICRQRPGTASGVVFMTLEDETGFINLVLWAKKFEALRRVATAEPLLWVSGRVDRVEQAAASEPPDGGASPDASQRSSQATIHIIVDQIAALETVLSAPVSRGAGDLGDLCHLGSMSRDFH
jgi:error-prone DNA polymerase